ncbi:MAG: hypothetical protein GXO76_12130 [Calditrichaeota bacterium]|nr:hypothetical protein [Calditrichota bacterium]
MKPISTVVLRTIQAILAILILLNVAAYFLTHSTGFLYMLLAYVFVLGMSFYRAVRGVQDSFYAGILGVTVNLIDYYRPHVHALDWIILVNIVLPFLLIVVSFSTRFKR